MISPVLFTSASEEWGTPKELFHYLNEEFNFEIDVAASVSNTKCDYYYTKVDNGLSKDWRDRIIWCNPPYGRKVGIWVEKLCNGGAKIAVALLPARTDTKWFHNYILGKAEIRFLKGRLKFGNSTNNAPFPSMVCIWRNAQ